jgi:parvulin-like peptidyl-prolyl isomerase
MGTMEKMRQTSPYLLAIFAIVFVGFMVASDADVSNLLKSGTNYQTSPIAEVNGEKLLYKDFEKRVMEVQDQQSKQMQAQGQEVNIDYMQIRRQTWKEMIEDILLRQIADEMGVSVSDKEMRYVLLNNPPDFLKRPFTDSAGNFLRESYIEIMTNPDVIYQRLPENMSQQEKQRTVEQFRADVIKIQNALRNEKLRKNINTVVSTSLSFVSPLFAKQKFLAENSTAEVNFIYIDPSSVKQEDIKVSEEEIREYYNKYKKLWPQKEKRKIKYIVFPMVPSHADTAKMMKAIAKLSKVLEKAETPEEKSKKFSQKMAEYNGETVDFTAVQDIPPQIMPYISNLKPNDIVGPIRMADGVYFLRLDEKRSGENVVVKASHILIGFGNNKDSAKALAMKVLKEAKKGNFAQLAMKYSTDRGSASKGGDLGYFGKGRMIPEFEKAAFGAKVGEVVGPVETQYGYHIIKVFDKKSDELKYSQIVFKPKMSRITKKGIARNAKEFKSRLEEGENFDEIAKSFNMTARETNFFERTMPVLGSNYLSARAFELNVGDIIDPINIKKVGVLVGQVSDIQPAGVVPLEVMKNKIEVRLLEKKRVKAMKSKAEQVYNEVKNLKTLLGYTPSDPAVKLKIAANIKNNGVVPGVGLDYKFTVEAFKLPLKTISKPIEGDKSYYIIEVLNRKIPDEKTVEAQLKDYMIQLRNNFKSGSFYQWFNAYKTESDIKDYRTEFFKEF